MKTNSTGLKKTFIKGIIEENPVLVSLLGMCPTLATTKSLESAIGMSLLVILVLIGSNVIISLLRNIIPNEIRTPAYIVIIATFVTIIKMLCNAYLPELYNSLGVFISLIVVNCIILGRAESFASKNGPLLSLMDALGSGIGFTIALCIMGLIREVLGTGGITIGTYFTFLQDSEANVRSFTPLNNYAISLFTQSTGGFITLGSILAFMAWRANVKNDRIEFEKKKKIEELKRKKALDILERKNKEAELAKEVQ